MWPAAQDPAAGEAQAESSLLVAEPPVAAAPVAVEPAVGPAAGLAAGPAAAASSEVPAGQASSPVRVGRRLVRSAQEDPVAELVELPVLQAPVALASAVPEFPASRSTAADRSTRNSD